MHDVCDANQVFAIVKADYDAQTKALKKTISESGTMLSNMLEFCEEAFDGGHEIVVLITELTVNPITSGFINKYGCDEYFKHNKELLIYDRHQQIAHELEMMELN